MTHSLLYSVEREYAADIATVWNAWTDAKALETWYHPTILEGLPGAFTSDATVGGIWTVAVDVPMNNFVAYFWGRYTAVEHHKHLAHTMSYSQDAQEFAARPADAPAHEVNVDFEARGDKTWVRFSQFGEMPEGQAEATKAGMESYFDSLEAYLGL